MAGRRRNEITCASPPRSVANRRPSPTIADARWTAEELAACAAGFFDGEGTIRVEGHPDRPAISMSVPQASPDGVPQVLDRFQQAVGGTIHGPRMVPSPWSRLPQYRWELRRFSEVERVVALLRPYADAVKLAQMDACIARVQRVRARRSA